FLIGKRPHRSCPPHLRSSVLDGGNDADISAAATEIAAHVFSDLLWRRGVALVDTGNRRHDLAGCAVAALQGVVIDECLLHGMQFTIRGRQAFDRRDLMSVHLRRQREARCDAAAFDVYGAGTTLSVVAAFLGARQTDPFAQHVEKRRAGIEREGMARPVYREVHRNRKRTTAAVASL